MYHLTATLATTKRILRQLSHDPRTIMLIFLVPCLLLSLLRWMFSDTLTIFDHFAPALLGVFPFIIMFIITSITTLRERVTGTMERLMVTPIAKLDLILGYMASFGLLAIVQGLLASVLLLYVFNLQIAGPDWFLIVVALLAALLGTALGLFVSAFAKSEFQAVQFMPVFALPQLLIGGLFVPLTAMPDVLEAIARCLPLTYVIDAFGAIAINADITADMWRDLWVVVGFILAAILLAGLTLRRKSK